MRSHATTDSPARSNARRTGVVLAAISLLVLAGAAQAANSCDRRPRKPQTTCKPSYSYSHSHYSSRDRCRSDRDRHRYRDRCSSRSRSGFRISIGSGYSWCSSSGGYFGTRYSTPRYTHTYYPSHTQSHTTYRTTYLQPRTQTVILSGAPTGTVYETASVRQASTRSAVRIETVEPDEAGWSLEDSAPLVAEPAGAPREVVTGRASEDQAIEIIGTTEEGVVYTIRPAGEAPLGRDAVTAVSAAQPAASAGERVVVVQAQAEPEPRLDRPWRELLEGSPATARALFADTVRAEPENAEARLGFIIAALRDGDRAAASSSMIRLLEEQPTLVRAGNLPESAALIRELARLSEELHRYEGHGVKQWERRMLIAFTDFLRSSIAEGQDAMRASRRAGAEGVAARNLWRLLGLSDKPLERVVRR